MSFGYHVYWIFHLLMLIIILCHLEHAGSCTNSDISISQSRGSTFGIPLYMVQIVNTCFPSGCPPSDIHVHCGWFACARIVNPTTFKRVSYDDYLVNGGRAPKTSHAIRFTYTNSFVYPLAFKSDKFCELNHEEILYKCGNTKSWQLEGSKSMGSFVFKA